MLNEYPIEVLETGDNQVKSVRISEPTPAQVASSV